MSSPGSAASEALPSRQTRPAPLRQPGEAGRLIAAGQAAERSGQRQEAIAHFEAALYCLTPDDAGQAALVLRLLARNHLAEGNPDAALDCAEAALAVAHVTSDTSAEGHALNVQASIHWSRGELDQAETLFSAARLCALEIDERALLGMTSANLGAIAGIRGELAEALHHFTLGLEQYRLLGRRHDMWVALNNIGKLNTDLHRWSEAERAYAEAVEISGSLGDRSGRIILEVNLAEMWLARGEPRRSSAALDVAERFAGETGDSAWAAHIAKLRGILLRDAGAPAEAERHFATAASLAESRHDVLLLAETLRESAELCRSEGRNREALQNLNRSHRLFTQLRARRELANVDRSVSRIENDFIQVVQKWGESIEAKDRYTQGHCVRVADLSCAIAAACGIEEQALFWFRIGALLHDVGKLIIPSEVLNKPGKLTADEWALIRSHPTVGVDMLAGIDFPWDVRPIIESHHERWDGSGYPHGLSRDAIPLSARILAVADVYDALTSVRSYKVALPPEAALEVMRRDIGAAFDPEVFTKFTLVFAQNQTLTRANEPPTPTAKRLVMPSAMVLATTPRSDDSVTRLATRESMARIAAQALADGAATGREVCLLVLELAAPPDPSVESARHNLALRFIARELRNATRTSDFIARTGRHQFMVLLRESTPRQAEAVERRIAEALARTSTHTIRDEASWVRTAVVSAPTDGATWPELLQNAERAIARDGLNRRASRAS